MLVDDEVQALNSFELALRSAGFAHFVRVDDSRMVMPRLAEEPAEVILLDLRMPHLSGDRLLGMIAGDYPEIPVIVVTAANDVDTAVKCMKGGAFDYILKPVEKSRLSGSVKRAVELRELQRENRLLKSRVLSDNLENPTAFAQIITASAAMRSIFRYAESVAASPRPVLITGETGVGKELIARAIHALSSRSGEFVAVNVAGLDDNIFADTLFGHVHGAFTDAREARGGLIERASGGTLFLDEIGDLSPASQVKLLRLLQDGEFFPLGADLPKHSDARCVFATNRELETLQRGESLRKDLYYRLSDHHIHVPPLRERREDLPPLLDHFLGKASATLGRKAPAPPPELVTLLGTYHFPGNVRELESMVFDAVSRHRAGTLSMDTFKAQISRTRNTYALPSSGTPAPEADAIAFPKRLPSLKELEWLLIEEAVRRSDGNQSVAALSLGITRQALNKRLLKRKKESGSPQ